MANASTLFQNMINEIFNDINDLGIVKYINDILIYTETKDKYEKLIIEVSSWLQKLNLVMSINTYEFHKSKIEFLGYIISNIGINMVRIKFRLS
jgi:hypothetical protein